MSEVDRTFRNAGGSLTHLPPSTPPQNPAMQPTASEMDALRRVLLRRTLKGAANILSQGVG